jgi:NTE family protein
LRHRFARDLASVPRGIEVHVLPAGEGAAPRWDSRAALRYRDVGGIGRRIDVARAATAAYLDALA